MEVKQKISGSGGIRITDKELIVQLHYLLGSLFDFSDERDAGDRLIMSGVQLSGILCGGRSPASSIFSRSRDYP